MRHLLRSVGLLGLLAMIGSGFAADDKPSPPKPDPKDVKEKTVVSANFVGRLVDFDTAARTFTIEAKLRFPVVRDGKVEVEERQENLLLKGTADMKVRILNLPKAFDNKGNIKVYTPAELKEMKGPGNLQGYTADFDSLKANQTVQIVLIKKVPLIKPPVKPAKEEPTEIDLSGNVSAKYGYISMIVVVADPPGP